jgi:ABC-type Fe3+-siderophore transport system permease subunit
LAENDENSFTARLSKSTSRTEWNFILLGCAFFGSASAFITIHVLQAAGMLFPLSYLLITSVLGALLGVIVAFIVRKHDGSRLASVAFASFIGLILPLCLLQMLFLVFPIDP